MLSATYCPEATWLMPNQTRITPNTPTTVTNLPCSPHWLPEQHASDIRPAVERLEVQPAGPSAAAREILAALAIHVRVTLHKRVWLLARRVPAIGGAV
eukprot:2884946-Rhodomonas_salina.1